jgi:ABC-type nitrate/sulfonate/bicarbonate transport system substrate-binding protein
VTVPPIRIGQFSESPVLAAARALGLDSRYGVDWVTERVQSSPGQFESLRSGEMDIAITSPDNVLLYATTEKNPLGAQLDLEFLRPIDRGLQLALYTTPEIQTVEDFTGITVGVDVMSSGFALLLLRMLDSLGVDQSSLSFEAVGATPKRLTAIEEGAVKASVLNAETAIKAEQAGLRRWATSTDVSDDYLGTVLAKMSDSTHEHTRAFLNMWEETTHAIIKYAPNDIVELLSAQTPQLATPAYVKILTSEEYGLITGEGVTANQLRVLADIRKASGAYTPAEADILRLAAVS